MRSRSGRRAGTPILCQIKALFLQAAQSNPRLFCATDLGGADSSRPNGAIVVLPGLGGNVSPCPIVVPDTN